jgi:hypothetical protein
MPQTEALQSPHLPEENWKSVSAEVVIISQQSRPMGLYGLGVLIIWTK